MKTRQTGAMVLAVVFCAGMCDRAQGAGFALQEQSPSAMGHAFAGASAGLKDASTVFFNPAGLAMLDRPQCAFGASTIFSTIDFENRGSQYPALGGQPVQGGNNGNAGGETVLGSLYGAVPINDRLAVGLGVFSPYGLAVKYASDWVGRYQAIDTELRTVAINPTVAVRLAERVFIGGGLSAQYVEAELSSAIDFGSLVNTGAGQLDGLANVKADDWDYGFNIGALIVPRNGSRIGISYRSKVRHTLRGDAHFEVPAPAAPLQAIGRFVDTTGSAELELPATVGIGLAQQCSPTVVLLADAVWTQWSAFDELRIDYDSAQPDSVTDESWHNAWRLAMGVEYYLDDTWTVRGGAAYDESPVSDVAHRTPRIPDASRTLVAVGVGYHPGDRIRFDAAYMRVAFEDTSVDRMGDTGAVLRGNFESSAHVVSLQFVCQI